MVNKNKMRLFAHENSMHPCLTPKTLNASMKVIRQALEHTVSLQLPQFVDEIEVNAPIQQVEPVGWDEIEMTKSDYGKMRSIRFHQQKIPYDSSYLIRLVFYQFL